jgi:hypothetical protein
MRLSLTEVSFRSPILPVECCESTVKGSQREYLKLSPKGQHTETLLRHCPKGVFDHQSSVNETAAENLNSRRGLATHPMISAVALSGEDAEAGGRRRRAANPIQAMAIPAAIQPISP